MNYEVRKVDKKDTHELLLNKHYAQRIPPISHAYGLFRDGQLAGVVTYGMPASPSLCKGVCGEQWKAHVLELNRLCLVDNLPNEASRLVGASLRLLPSPLIVVSYADSAQEHVGYIYQATNFLYTGMTVKRTEWAIRGLEKMHTKSICNTVAHINKPVMQALQDMYGDRFYYRERSQKYRYVKFIGNKKERNTLMKALRYNVLPYPKGER